MLRVLLSQAEPGMILGLPLYHPLRPGTILLRAGVALDGHTINRLREMRLREVWIRYPSLDFIAEYVNPGVIGAAQEVAEKISTAFDQILADAAAKLSFFSYRDAIGALLEKFAEVPKAALLLHEIVGSDMPFLRHAVNTCLVSVLMGIKLDFYLVRERTRMRSVIARDVSNLGVGAMLHDVGMMRLEPAVLYRWNTNRDESDPAWREHVNLGYRMVRGEIEPSSAAAIQHHHQHFDGSGFPTTTEAHGAHTAPMGSDIHVFARIVAAADLLDRLRHPAHAPLSDERSAPSIPTVRALRLMQQRPYWAWLDPIVFRALISVVPPYPPGTVVRLNDGRRAVVSDWTPEDPCRPTVHTLPPGLEKPERVDLKALPGLRIVEADGFDVSRDNFYPSYKGHFDLTPAALGMSQSPAPDGPLKVRRRPRPPRRPPSP